MTKLVAILNVTPDSFSDGGQFLTPSQAAAHIQSLVEEGADVIDIGAESTRPGAIPVSADEEWQRLCLVLGAAQSFPVEISVDTRHPETARRALDLGAHWINDVGGFSDPLMLDAVKNHSCKLVAMHSLGVPPSPDKTLPPGSDVVREILNWSVQTLARLDSQGIARDRIILDPGIGFGKTPQQSLELIQRVDELKDAMRPLLIGHSRKSFLSAKPAPERDAETLALSESMAQKGVDYLRVHNIPLHRRMLERQKHSLPS